MPGPKNPIVTEIVMAVPLYPAEEYRQDYHLKYPISYKYSHASGVGVRACSSGGALSRGTEMAGSHRHSFETASAF